MSTLYDPHKESAQQQYSGTWHVSLGLSLGWETFRQALNGLCSPMSVTHMSAHGMRCRWGISPCDPVCVRLPPGLPQPFFLLLNAHGRLNSPHPAGVCPTDRYYLCYTRYHRRKNLAWDRYLPPSCHPTIVYVPDIDFHHRQAPVARYKTAAKVRAQASTSAVNVSCEALLGAVVIVWRHLRGAR